MERLFKEHEWANGEQSDYTLGNQTGMGIAGKRGLDDGEVLRLYVAHEINKALLGERKRNGHITYE